MLQRFVALNITLSLSAFKLLNGSLIFTYTLKIYDLTHRDAFTWYNNLYLRLEFTKVRYLAVYYLE